MSKLALSLVSVSAISVLGVAAGCGSDSAGPAPPASPPDGGSDAAAPAPLPADEIQAVPFASTKMLTTADLASLEPDKEDGKLVFDHAPASLADAAVGTIMVAGVSPSTPHGFLRVVTNVARAGDALTLQTQGAPPQLAFQKLHARVARPASLDDAASQPSGALEPLDLGVGGTSERKVPVNVVLFDGDGDTSTTDDQLRIEGSYQGAITYDLAVDVDWGAIDKLPDVVQSCIASLAKIVIGKKPSCAIDDLIPEVKVTFTVEPAVASDLHLIGQASLGFEKEFDLVAVPLSPIVLGPIVFLPRLEVIAKIEGDATASFKAGVAAHMTLESSVTVSSKTAGSPTFSPPSIKDKGFTVDPPEVGLHAHAQANAGVRLEMPLYGTVGPYATAEATLAIEADASKTPCWELHAGLEDVIGVRITTPALPFLGHVTLVNWSTAPLKAIDEVVASGNCTDPPPGVSHLPPGSGPDAPALRDPTFTPWSHLEETTLSGTTDPGPEVTGQVFSDVERAIDGRWIVAGSDARTVVKIDDTGKTIWRAAYSTTDTQTALSISRTAPTRDAAIVALSSGVGGTSFGLFTVGQSGAVRAARSFMLPLDACAAPSARVLAPDGGAGTGYTVVGECVGQGKAFVVHVDAGLDVTAARIWSLDGASHFGPTAFTRTTTSQLAVTGNLSTTAGSDGMFVARLDDAGNIVTTDSYTTCATATGVSPTVVTPAGSNGLYIAGGSYAQGRAFVASVHEDGSVGFTTYPGIAAGSAPVFVPGGLAELPTTGFVMATSMVELTAVDSTVTPAVALVGLDASGHAAWAKRYQLANRSSSFPSLRLTTDGGALVSSFAYPSDSATTGGTWSFKAFAKDGTLADPNVTATVLPMDDGAADCLLERAAVTPSVADLDVDIAPLAITRK